MNEVSIKLGDRLAWVGYTCITTLVLIRAMVEHDSFPQWQMDPFVFSPPVIGLTPVKTLAINLGVVLSSCLVLLGLYLKREQIGLVNAILMLIGISIIAHHGFHSFESVVEGSNLLAIVSVLYAASFAYKIHDAQRGIAGVVLGFVAMLVIMGAYEMFVVHPETVTNYELSRDSFLDSRGWSPGSFEALAYERRLYQAEPIAWFGLTNVFASFAGACGAGLLILGWNLRKINRVSVVFFIGGFIAISGLLMTGAKGGFGAFALGFGLTMLAKIVTRRALDGRAIACVCGLVVIGVIARGLIGERLGELSLLFRSQYITGSIRMYFDQPIFGVGPGAFQENYAIFKPALSPEDVASAHSFPFDLIAALGIGGMALLVMFIRILGQIRPNIESKQSHPILDKRQTVQVTMLMIAVASVISIRFGSPAMDINLFLVQVLASLAWGVIAFAVVSVGESNSTIRWALFAGASVLAIHSMIEVTATWMVSGILFALLIGSACTSTAHSRLHPKLANQLPLIVTLGLVGGGIVNAMRLPALFRWESELRLAGEPAMQISSIRQKLNELEFSLTPNQLREQIAMELTEMSGYRVESSIDQIINELNGLELEGRSNASRHLIEATQIRPTHMPTFIAASQQILWEASVRSSIGQLEESDQLWDRSLDLLVSGTNESKSASGYQWLGSVWHGRAIQFPDNPERALWLSQAHKYWIEAMRLNPYNPHMAVKLMNLALERNQDDEAINWAKRAVDLHENSRLDPLRGIRESDLMRIRGIAQRETKNPAEVGP
jgi:hypothetical protein